MRTLVCFAMPWPPHHLSRGIHLVQLHPWVLVSSPLFIRLTCQSCPPGLLCRYGEWNDTHKHGEVLQGWWKHGVPAGPFRSRESGSGAGAAIAEGKGADCSGTRSRAQHLSDPATALLTGFSRLLVPYFRNRTDGIYGNNVSHPPPPPPPSSRPVSPWLLRSHPPVILSSRYLRVLSLCHCFFFESTMVRRI